MSNENRKRHRIHAEPIHVNAAITPIRIWQIMFDVKDGDADPVNVKWALRAIYETLGAGLPLSREMRVFLKEGLKRFFDHDYSLDQAFSLKRTKRGRPGLPPETCQTIAAEILRQRLVGRSLEYAAQKVGSDFDIGSTEARRHWSENKLYGYMRLRSERPAEKCPWTNRELVALEKIFGRDERRFQLLVKTETRISRKKTPG